MPKVITTTVTIYLNATTTDGFGNITRKKFKKSVDTNPK